MKLAERFKNVLVKRSHPAGVRGLKRRHIDIFLVRPASHPAGVRGLKPCKSLFLAGAAVVAPRRGAWVETMVTLTL